MLVRKEQVESPPVGIIQPQLAGVQCGGFAASETYAALIGDNFGYTGTNQFTFNATGCVLTYAGTRAGAFLVTAMGSISANPADAGLATWGIDHNGDLIGDAIWGAGPCLQNITDDSNQYMTSVQYLMFLQPGDTLRPAGAASGPIGFNMTTFTMSVLWVGPVGE